MAKSPLSTNRFFIIFISWWAIWAFLQTGTLLSFGLNTGAALVDSVVTNGLVGLSCGFLANNMQYYIPKQERYWYIFFISLGLTTLVLLACKAILVTLIPDKVNGVPYSQFFNKSWAIRYDLIFLQIGCMAILSVLWYSTVEERENRQRHNEVERLAKEAELFKLRQQLAPHFLFNSLNSISALIGSQPEQARKMIQQLSDFLRGNLRKDEQQFVPLSEELQYLELYLDIEKVRFGHRLDTHITCDADCITGKLPPMLLQPIVENAIKFGLYDTTEQVTIAIRARVEGQYVIIEVENPFDPETSRPKKGTGFGLTSIQRRLYLLFARPDLLETRVDGNLFTTIVRIPQLESPVPRPESRNPNATAGNPGKSDAHTDNTQTS